MEEQSQLTELWRPFHWVSYINFGYVQFSSMGNGGFFLDHISVDKLYRNYPLSDPLSEHLRVFVIQDGFIQYTIVKDHHTLIRYNWKWERKEDLQLWKVSSQRLDCEYVFDIIQQSNFILILSSEGRLILWNMESNATENMVKMFPCLDGAHMMCTMQTGDISIGVGSTRQIDFYSFRVHLETGPEVKWFATLVLSECPRVVPRLMHQLRDGSFLMVGYKDILFWYPQSNEHFYLKPTIATNDHFDLRQRPMQLHDGRVFVPCDYVDGVLIDLDRKSTENIKNIGRQLADGRILINSRFRPGFTYNGQFQKQFCFREPFGARQCVYHNDDDNKWVNQTIHMFLDPFLPDVLRQIVADFI